MQRVTIPIAPELEDFLEEWLWIQGAVSVSTLPPHVADRTIGALFQTLDRTRFKGELTKALIELGGKTADAAFDEVPDDDWQNRWRENFQPLQVGGFRIVGEWESEPDDPKTIRVYPGQAFGTGQHETTRLIIRALETMDLTNKTVMDAGCGTGILAIAAERLGARSVFGFDLDPDCAENMAHHLHINRAKNISLKIGKIEDFEQTGFDLILANITINVLVQLWPELAKRIAPGGLLLSSGILAEQEDEAVQALKASGFQIQSKQKDGEWLLIQARKS